ncbi:MAG TPA: flippase [Aggregatilinea sp.]|uniref:flippase n=1 Tax=Aggregatilinea sp. TaxID=2806333 RepID=UPI002CC927BE|nr:flippase [Aggregatilinea sp.]HML22585.1 flippase [Aggregatilinea sp.]
MDAETALESPGDLSVPTAEAATESTTRRAARNATAMALSQISAKGLLFIWQLMLARWLGDEGYGVYGTIGALLAVGAVLPDFGMGMIVVRDVANHPKDASRYLSASLTMQPVLAVVGYGVLMIAAILFGYDSELRALLALAGVSLLVDTLGNICHNQLLAAERMVIPAVISTAHVGILVALAAIALSLGGGLWGLYVATITAGVARTSAYWIALTRVGTRPHFPLDRGVARSMLINGAPLAMAAFLAQAYNHADKLITTAVLGAEGTGQLTAGFVIVFGVVEILSTTVLVAVFPLMSRTYSSGQRAMFEFMLEKLAFFNLTLSLPLAIYTSLLAVPLSGWLFGPEFTRTADVLKILIWYTVVNMVGNVFAQALLTQNRQRRLLVIRASGLALNIALLAVLLPRVGVQGAAIATLIAETTILTGILTSFDFPADWWGRARSHLWRLGLAAAGLMIIVLLLRRVHPLLAGIIGLPTYAALALVSGAVARDDWDLIYRMAIAMPGGHLIARYWKRELG